MRETLDMTNTQDNILRSVRLQLENVLSRESILDNIIIQECFNKNRMGFSLDSISKLDIFEELGRKYFRLRDNLENNIVIEDDQEKNVNINRKDVNINEKRNDIKQKDLTNTDFNSEDNSNMNINEDNGDNINNDNININENVDKRFLNKIVMESEDILESSKNSDDKFIVEETISNLNYDRTELMYAIAMSANLSSVLDLCIYEQDGNIIDLESQLDLNNLETDLDREKYENISRIVRDFLLKNQESNIYVKPIFKIERTTLILRDLDSEINENDIFDLLKKCPYFIQENMDIESNDDQLKRYVVNIRREVHDTWFITLVNEELTTNVALWLRGQKLKGEMLRVGIKSEHPIASLLSVISVNKSSNSAKNRKNLVFANENGFVNGFPGVVNGVIDNFSPIPISGSVLNIGGVGSNKMGFVVDVHSSNPVFLQNYNQNMNSDSKNSNEGEEGSNNANDSQNYVNHDYNYITPVPMIYPYPSGISRTVGLPTSNHPLNVYAMPGAPSNAIIAPIMVVPNVGLDNGLSKSDKNDIVNSRTSKKHESKKNTRAEGANNETDHHLSLRNDLKDNQSKPNNDDLDKNENEVEDTVDKNRSHNINQNNLIPGVSPIFYGVTTLADIQSMNLQYIGNHSHPHILIPNSQFQYQNQMNISANNIDGNNNINNNGISSTKSSSLIENQRNESINSAPIYPNNYCHGVHYYFEDTAANDNGYVINNALLIRNYNSRNLINNNSLNNNQRGRYNTRKSNNSRNGNTRRPSSSPSSGKNKLVSSAVNKESSNNKSLSKVSDTNNVKFSNDNIGQNKTKKTETEKNIMENNKGISSESKNDKRENSCDHENNKDIKNEINTINTPQNQKVVDKNNKDNTSTNEKSSIGNKTKSSNKNKSSSKNNKKVNNNLNISKTGNNLRSKSMGKNKGVNEVNFRDNASSGEPRRNSKTNANTNLDNRDNQKESNNTRSNQGKSQNNCYSRNHNYTHSNKNISGYDNNDNGNSNIDNTGNNKNYCILNKNQNKDITFEYFPSLSDVMKKKK